MGYNLQRDGWLNSFTDEKNQAMKEDGVPWRGAREKRHEFYSILFSALTDKDDIVMDWQCGLGLFSTSLIFNLSFSTTLFLCITTSHNLILNVLGASIIACHALQHHIVALKAAFDIFNALLLPMRDPDPETTSR
jgi:hypothetical protein